MFKIIEHNEGSKDSVVTGQLVGLDLSDDPSSNSLHVANCFPNLPAHDSSAGMSNQAYEAGMLRNFRSSAIDHGIVGWYVASSHSMFTLSTSTIETQLMYQKSIPNSFVLVYDSLQTQLGTLGIRAFRLTPSFLKHMKEKKPLSTASGRLIFDSEDMLEEVPISITVSKLLQNPGLKLACLDHNCFSVKLNKSLCIKVHDLIGRLSDKISDLLDVYVADQNKLALKKKRKVDESSLTSIVLENLVVKWNLYEYAKYVCNISAVLSGSEA